MEFKLTGRNKSHTAFTMVEMMVGVSLGLLILAAVGSLYIFSAKSFISMSNYSDLSNRNRHASDIVSRDIRCALSVASVTNNALVLHMRNGDVSYLYDPNGGTLIRSQLGATQTLLQAVTDFSFALYARPTNGAAYEVLPPATPSTAKFVAFKWLCARRVYASQTNSHGLEAAIIELRNE